jgi:glutamate dehydrogenase/leucine dehydrogenase
MKLLDNFIVEKNLVTQVKLYEGVTGFGVASSIKHICIKNNTPLKGKSAYIQGSGNVGAATAYYLWKLGVKIIAIEDYNFGLKEKNGIKHKD